ncbi:MAG TPA: diphosphate--fructose-6-phosphate 1-phosphotransferase [Acidobacteriaceae bacterium]|nr:diphosphate--fructose-6-phosphate 1-phosphotransferase [Acidobacteriaceae bacterium]
MPESNLMIVQGGGPTAVFNASLAEIIAEAQRQPSIRSIFGSRYGIGGLFDDRIVDLTDASIADLELLRRTPGAALGSSRHSPTESELKKSLETLDRLKIDLLLFLGGNGTMRGAEIISKHCTSQGLDIRVLGVPKTIDNDIAATDRCPGYASAARYIATAAQELAADLRSLPQPVTILETMGRSVGWIAAATVLARTNDDSAPHLIYVPEVPFETEAFLSDLSRIVKRIGWAVVVVAEGIRHADGTLVYESSDSSQSDPLKRPMTGGVAQHLATIVSQRLGIRCRSEKPGLLGRASVACTSARDVEDAQQVGRAGVQALVSGQRDVMIALEPLGSEHATRIVPLAQAAGHERTIPDKWLQSGPIPVSKGFIDYVRPLVGPLEQHITELGRAVCEIGAK